MKRGKNQNARAGSLARRAALARGLRLSAMALLLALTLSFVPLFDLSLSAAEGPGSDAVVYDQGGVIVISQSGDYVILGSGKTLLSITVTGEDTEANIYLYDVVIENADVASAKFSADSETYFNGTAYPTAPQALNAAGKALGWYKDNGTAGNSVTTGEYQWEEYYVPTCPFLVTGGATANVQFNGTNTFRAGVNNSYVRWEGASSGWFGSHDESWAYRSVTPSATATAGYAGVQVDPGATLVLSGTAYGTLNAYGAWQFSDGSPLNRNDDGGYVYKRPGSTGDLNGGGAGIGGGASYNANEFSDKPSSEIGYGAAGTIVINGGDGVINAYGGHQAAGIGGACNSPATTTSITINSGTLNVQGGRWAAGIGDGDTAKFNIANNTDFFVERYSDDGRSYTITINGGTLDVSGGVAAAGIGTSDSITLTAGDISNTEADGGAGDHALSRMAIQILGGTLKVRSGFPDVGTNGGSYANVSTTMTAAIGAGQNTVMRENSITVAADVQMDAASFSQYAISNNGKTAETPVVNLDSSGRLFLCNFIDYPSTTDRTVSLYPAIRVTVDFGAAGGIFETQLLQAEGLSGRYFVPTLPHEDGADRQRVCLQEVIYDPSTHTATPIAGKEYHGKEWRLGQNTETEYPSSYVYGEEGSAGYEEISAYDIHFAFDESNPLYTYHVPDYFKAIAVTLPTPSPLYPGEYVLTLPMNGIDTDKEHPEDRIVVNLTAYTQGTVSGKVEYPTNGNIVLDPVSSGFVDIDVFAGTEPAGREYIGFTYDPATGVLPLYAYTVYLPAGTNAADIRVVFREGEVTFLNLEPDDSRLSEGTIVIGGETFSYVNLYGAVSTGTPLTVRIQKKDEGKAAVTYAITLCVREEYTLTLGSEEGDLDRVYNGQPFAVANDQIALTDPEGNPVGLTGTLTGQIVYTYYDANDPTTPLSSAPVNAGEYTLTARLVPEGEPWQAEVSVKFSIEPRPLTVTGVENWVWYVANDEDAQTFKGPVDPGEIYFTGAVSGDAVDVTVPADSSYFVKTIIEQFAGGGDNAIRLFCSVVNDPYGNYSLQNLTAEGYVDVPGRLYYDMNGAIFRKDTVGSVWDKFFPVNSDTPLEFPGAADDYQHQHGSHTHSQYVLFHSVNGGEAEKRYSVDVTYGGMNFVFTQMVWDVNQLEYVGTGGTWLGDDGSNNRVLVENYSNDTVEVSVTVSVAEEHRQQAEGYAGITAGLYTIGDDGERDYTTGITDNTAFHYRLSWSALCDAATPRVWEEDGSVTEGSAGEAACYVELGNIPKFSTKATIGSITVTVARSGS